MPDNLKPLLYWVKEREAIRKRKIARAENEDTANDNSLTKDPILATYRFCNVRRRDDRVSRWLINNVLTEENLSQDITSFMLFSAWCRWVNWPPTIQMVMEAETGFTTRVVDWKRIGLVVDQIAKNGKAWTGAYMIRAPRKKGGKKGAFIAQEVIGKHLARGLGPVVELFAQNGDNTHYQQVHAVLMTIPNFGSFMAGQIAGDWTYTSLLSNAPDLKTWAPMGPGSVRGFNRIMQNPGKLSKRPPEALWLEKLVKWRAEIIKRLGPEYEDLTLLDCQNQLCEVDKYLRVKNGEGRPRAKYRPETAY
jgi:alpha-glutamyl/putrescinyl thymine pyrophosphorylase clade 1